ncbi:MAG: hypothetical protein ACK5P5_01040 [Pseudobdellovibrionaceae bacterium]
MKLKTPVLFSSFPLILILAVTIFGSSCAFDTNRKDDRREKNDLIDEEIQEIQKTASNKCESLQGFYEGFITTSTRKYTTEVGVYCEPTVIDKKDGSGNVVSILTPFMVITRTDIAQRDKFKISFNQQTTEISNDGAPIPSYKGVDGTLYSSVQTNSFTGIVGRADGTRIQASITAQAPFGNLDVERSADKVFSIDDQADFKKLMEKLADVISLYEGKFCGHFKVRGGDPINYFNAELIITLQKISDLNYRVVGRFNVIDADGQPSQGVLDRPTKLFFDFEESIAALTVDSVITFPGSYHFTMNGDFGSDKMSFAGTYIEDIGTAADFYMKKMKYSGKPPKKCFDDAKKKLAEQ